MDNTKPTPDTPNTPQRDSSKPGGDHKPSDQRDKPDLRNTR